MAIQKVDVPEGYRTTVVDHVEPLLGNLYEGKNRQFIYPLAYVYAKKFSGNPYYRDKKIFKALVDLGNQMAKTKIDQRLCAFWIDAYELVNGGTLYFPCIPHNPYGPSSIHDAFLRFEVPVIGKFTGRSKIKIRVK